MRGQGLIHAVFAGLVLLGACGPVDLNCLQCGSSVTLQNKTDRVVEVIFSDERGASPMIRLEPGHEHSGGSGGIPARGDLNKLFLTFRATDLSGEVVFCERVSWRQSLDRGGVVQIVLGEVRC